MQQPFLSHAVFMLCLANLPIHATWLALQILQVERYSRSLLAIQAFPFHHGYFLQENGDELLIAAAAELVVALSKTYSQAYSSIWRQEHYSIALEHLRPSKPSGVRVAAMGEPVEVSAVSCVWMNHRTS